MSCKNYKVGPNEICPSRGVVYNKNINGLSGKDKNLDSLLEPQIDITITKGVMVYCVQETWVVGNSVVMVRGHMIFLHNRVKRVEGIIGRNPGGVAIILAPSAVVAWKEPGLSPPTTTPLTSKFVGRFVGIKMSFPKFDKWGKRVRDFLKIFVASIYHTDDIKESG